MPEESQPLLRIVRGAPDDVEVAALATVVAGMAAAVGQQAAVRPTVRSAWADRTAMLRRPLPHGPGAWRASALPR